MTRRLLLQNALAAVMGRDPLCWILLDLPRSRETVHWPDAGRLVCFGSLLKPFLTLAYGETHDKFPVVECGGTRDGCWLRRGHGKQEIVSALANSCNVYFLHLARETDRAALDNVCLSYGLTLPGRSLAPGRLVGLGAGWPNAPRAVAAAFSRLASNHAAPNVDLVLQGMARCAKTGTAKNIHINCYAKTGTAPCSHSPAAPGDGFTVAIFPTGQPRMVLLLERHGTPGAEACRDVNQVLANVSTG